MASSSVWNRQKKIKEYSSKTLKKKYRELSQITDSEEVNSLLSEIRHELLTVRGIDPDKESETEFYTTMGHLFEFYVYQAIKSFSLMNIDPGNFKYNGQIIEDPGGAASTAHKTVQNWKEKGSYNNSVIRFEEQIIQAAEGVCQNLIFKWMQDLNKNIEVSLIADEESGGKGSPLGDLLLKIGGRTVVLELKWQTGKNIYTPIRWFSGVADKRLFGASTFSKFLSENEKSYWSYTQNKTTFMHNLTTKALLAHLGTSPDAITSYLIGKGNVAEELKTLKTIGGSEVEKMTVRISASTAQVDVQNMDVSKIIADEKLQFDLEKGARKIKIMAQANGQNPYHAASFWLSGMGSLSSEKKKDRKGPENYPFSFSMFIQQKLFFDLENEASFKL